MKVFRSDQISHSVVSDSLRPHESQHARPPYHHLPEFTQTHVHRVSDAIQPSHPLSSPSPPAPNSSQHQSLFQWVNSSHEVAKVLEFQLQHHSLQRNPRAYHHWLNRHEFEANSGRLLEDGGAWRAAVHGVTNSWTRLSDWATTKGTGNSTQHFVITYKGKNQKKKAKYISESLCCTPETNMIL